MSCVVLCTRVTTQLHTLCDRLDRLVKWLPYPQCTTCAMDLRSRTRNTQQSCMTKVIPALWRTLCCKHSRARAARTSITPLTNILNDNPNRFSGQSPSCGASIAQASPCSKVLYLQQHHRHISFHPHPLQHTQHHPHPRWARDLDSFHCTPHHS